MATIAVYTAIFPSNYTTLHRPQVYNPNVDYLVISDGVLNVDPWFDITVKRTGLSSRREMQPYKMLSHKKLTGYDYVIWIDGCAILKADPVELVQRMLDESDCKVAFGRHPWRECLYEEAEFCARYHYDKEEVIEAQMARYRADGFPEHHGLIASTFFIRDNKDPDVSRLFECWLDETTKGSRRNQLSFNYASWKTGVPYYEIPLGGWGSNAVYKI